MLTRALRHGPTTMLADAVDRVKTSREDRPLIAVGGGSILVPDESRASARSIRPEHFDVANAIGAAIASASGEVDRIFHLGTAGREAAIDGGNGGGAGPGRRGRRDPGPGGDRRARRDPAGLPHEPRGPDPRRRPRDRLGVQG